MMGVYIKGIEMPTGNHEIIIRIQSDGRVLDQRGHRLCLEPFAVPVPPHGRLVDADDVNNHIHGWVDLRGCPTVIPAEEADAKDINVPTTYDLLYEEGGSGTT